MDPLRERELASQALDTVAKAAADYLTGLDQRLVSDPAATKLLAGLRQPLPEDGLGTLESVDELLRVEGRARNELTQLDDEEPEVIEQHRSEERNGLESGRCDPLSDAPELPTAPPLRMFATISDRAGAHRRPHWIIRQPARCYRTGAAGRPCP